MLGALAGRRPPPRVAKHARLSDPETGEILDDAIILWFPGPHSLTGEDVAELQLHGSRAVLTATMATLARRGLRLAEPGEFTRRAFFNGKFDLTQAEAVADLTAAETEAQRRQALRQLDGELGALYRGWSDRLMRLLAHLEAAIDFPDEDLPPEIEAEVGLETARLADEMEAHLGDHRRGERLRDGISIAIVGPVNAGKSTLLNVLAQRDAAITSPVPGTTRDVIEVVLDLGGYPVIVADTAGLRESADVVEREGLRRARQRAATADLRLYVYDATDPEGWVGAAAWRSAQTVVAANKIDRLTGGEAGLPEGVLGISALTGEGIPALLDALTKRIAAGYQSTALVLTRARHREAVEIAAIALRRSGTVALAELRAEDLRLAWRSLGGITGGVDVEELLNVIFADFCLGK